jgi:dolichyl-diphosphooligosaccharide--protein glycosyltransferase/undecaprenyl-diphosphooligosaccharide--protein glycosyltransferase
MIAGKSEKIEIKYVWLLMILAYFFSIAIRMIWVYQFQDNPNFYWNNELMINTNDGYTWASSAQNVLSGLHEHNPRMRTMWSNGVIFFTVLFTKFTPFSLETVILYMPAVISSFVVIPIILISRLYNQSVWGFFAALLGGIAWSYYNRTMTGYYDTDMFSAMAPMFILYFLMKSTMDFTPRSALYAAIAIVMYPFLYDQGKSIMYAMGIIYALYMIYYHRKDNNTYFFIILVFFALLPIPIAVPYNYAIKIILLLLLYIFLKKTNIEQKKLMVTSGILLLLFMYFGNVFGLIVGKVMGYVSTGTAEEGLHFYGVKQTIREAGQIPFETFANRISGSQIGVIISFIGYIVLVIKHRAFILALPLIGIGIFALWGGLRFTVYAVPIAAMSAIYLFHVISQMISDKKSIYLLAMSLMTAFMIYPNITHIIGYKVPTVLNKAEVEDLVKLKATSNSKDYTLTWWDYGYPVWFYSNTNTIIDGGKHNNDNFIISKIMQTTSPELAANLSRLAVETYVDSNYTTIADTLFKNEEEDQVDPNLLLSELENDTYELPKKTRDIFLYLPYRMLNIFPTVAIFGNLDLTTGKAERKIVFYPTSAVNSTKGILKFNNGITFDTKSGEVTLGKINKRVKYFIITQNMKDGKLNLHSQLYHTDGEYAVIYMKSYNKFIVMDTQTFNSMYVQMFILEKYDKNLFELVVSSPYSKIYKLKK